MPKYGQRLPYVSRDDADPEMSISPEDWSRLEQSFGRTISNSARTSLLEVCDRYLSFATTERKAAKVSDVKAYALRADKIFKPFLEYAMGMEDELKETGAGRDAWAQFQYEFQRHLEAHPFKFAAGDVEIEHAGLLSSYTTEHNVRLPVSLSLNDLMLVALRIDFALKNVIKGCDEAENSALNFKPGRAFAAWLHALKEWAKANELPRSPLNHDGLPGPIAELTLALHQIFPAHLKEVGVTSAIIAERMKKAGRRRGE